MLSVLNRWLANLPGVLGAASSANQRMSVRCHVRCASPPHYRAHN